MPDGRPNIVFILTDDLGWGDLRPYGGNVRLQTPNLNRLASQGTIFTNFYVNAPMCSSSRAAFMTGLFPARIGFHREIRVDDPILDPQIMTVTRLLQQIGYTTALFGKWHLGRVKAPDLGAYGIDVHRTTHSKGKDFPNRRSNRYWALPQNLWVSGAAHERPTSSGRVALVGRG